VPVLLRADFTQIKKKKAKRKAKTQWGDFNRQAKRRGKAVTLQPGTYMLLVSICVYGRGFLAFVFGCLSFQINVVLKRLELDSYWALNEGETDAHLWNDRAGTEAIDSAHTSDLYSAQAEFVAQPCVYCGTAEKVGVDRVRNNESYTRENSVPCCGRCNMAKRNASLRDFVLQARAIAKTTRAVAQEDRRPKDAPPAPISHKPH
jgi:hypothetical protein